MKYKELYTNTWERRAQKVIGIKENNIMVEGKPLNKIKENWIIALAIVAIIIGFLLVRFNLQLFLICIALFALFVVLFIIGNTYKVSCQKESITIKQAFQKEIHIPYDIVENVYIGKTSRWSSMYILVVRCVDKLSLLREFEFPLFCSEAEDVSKFINNFKVNSQPDPNMISLDKKKSLRKLVENIMTIFFVVVILWYLLSNGIIKF